MSFASEASKLVCNKYFLYFIAFLAATNVLGYIVTNKINAVIFFALVAFLMTNFSKNMAIVLLVAIIATNLLMANKSMREGLENANKVMENDSNLENVDPDLQKGLDALKATGNVDDAKAKLSEKKTAAKAQADAAVENGDMETKSIKDINNLDMNKKTTDPETFKSHEPMSSKKSGFHNAKGGSAFKDAAPVNGGSRIDYASTLEGAFDNLDKILGSDGINKLTGDTQKLMVQQQKLFETMQGMVPMINQAKDMMTGIDMGKLGGLADMANSLK
jgi:competence protein ComGC